MLAFALYMFPKPPFSSLSLLMNLIRLKQDLRGSQREQQPLAIFLLSYFICFFSGFERPHSFPFLFLFVERGLCFFFIRLKSMVFGVLRFFQFLTNLDSHVIIFSIYLAQQSWILFTSVLYMSTRYCALWCRPLSHVQNTLLIIILSSHIKGTLSFILIYYYNFLDFILFFLAAKNLIIYIEITLNHPRVLNYYSH